LGTSPAVLTEALWYLVVKGGNEVEGVTCIGTSAAREATERRLFALGPEGGPCVFDRLEATLAAMGYPGALCGRDQIEWAEEPLADFDNRDRAQALVLDHTCIKAILGAQACAEGPVVACISGGRKTMSSSLQQAMTLLARPEDMAIHMLVGAVPDSGLSERDIKDQRFYFPEDPGVPEMAGKVRLDVFEIPLVRLRDHAMGFDERSLLEPDYIARLQRTMDEASAPPTVRLNLRSRRLTVFWGKRVGGSTELSQSQALLLAVWIEADRPILRSEMALPMGSVLKKLRDASIHGDAEDEKGHETLQAWEDPGGKLLPPIQHELNDAILRLHPALERFTIKSRWGKAPASPGRPLSGRFGFTMDVYDHTRIRFFL
jgi:CRISPR-associated protein (TIGR02584 family)